MKMVLIFYSALQNDRPIFEKIGQFFSVYTVTCKQTISSASFDGNRAWGRTASAFHGAPPRGTFI